MGCPHTTFYVGKRVRVVLTTGERFVAKFRERRNRHVFFEVDEAVRKIPHELLKSATIYKEPQR